METINKETLLSKISNKENFIIQYSASWCGPCRILTPILENIGLSAGIDIFKFDISEDSQFALDKKIMSIPYVEYYKSGELINHSIGQSPREFYEEQINEVYK